MLTRSCNFILLTLLSSGAMAIDGIEIRESIYEGREQFTIATPQCEWSFDRSGGGFSRLIDRDGRDWIAFGKQPLATYPDSAAAGYRGIPNCVFVGPDKGAGHPGFDQCTTELVADNKIRTGSKSGAWTWTWTFHEEFAEFHMEQAGSDAWWFLYEGPIAGSFQPQHKLWGTDTLGLRTDRPDNRSQFFSKWQRLYVADRRLPRVLFIDQQQPDEVTDTFWYLGSANSGSLESPDGMVVVGFGRGEKTTPQLQGSGHKFRVGLVELDRLQDLQHDRIQLAIDRVLDVAE